jgi:hypothetical protein
MLQMGPIFPNNQIMTQKGKGERNQFYCLNKTYTSEAEYAIITGDPIILKKHQLKFLCNRNMGKQIFFLFPYTFLLA